MTQIDPPYQVRCRLWNSGRGGGGDDADGVVIVGLEPELVCCFTGGMCLCLRVDHPLSDTYPPV